MLASWGGVRGRARHLDLGSLHLAEPKTMDWARPRLLVGLNYGEAEASCPHSKRHQNVTHTVWGSHVPHTHNLMFSSHHG